MRIAQLVIAPVMRASRYLSIICVKQSVGPVGSVQQEFEMDKIKEFIEELPCETIQECYLRNAAREADAAITARPDLQDWHRKQAKIYQKLALRR